MLRAAFVVAKNCTRTFAAHPAHPEDPGAIAPIRILGRVTMQLEVAGVATDVWRSAALVKDQDTKRLTCRSLSWRAQPSHK